MPEHLTGSYLLKDYKKPKKIRKMIDKILKSGYSSKVQNFRK